MSERNAIGRDKGGAVRNLEREKEHRAAEKVTLAAAPAHRAGARQ